MKVLVMKDEHLNSVEYESQLNLHDLTSLMGYLKANDLISEYKILDYTVEELNGERNEEQYNKEKDYLKNV